MNKQNITILIIIVLGLLTRFLPHPPNFTAIGAMALFGAAYFSNKKLGLFLPLSVLLVTDLLMEVFKPGTGFYSSQIFVYTGMALIGLVGFKLRNKKSVLPIAGGALGGSIIFFIVSNLGVWFVSGMYPLNFGGLVACFGAAVPFFHWTVLSNLLFSGVFFGVAHLIGQKYPALVPVRVKQ